MPFTATSAFIQVPTLPQVLHAIWSDAAFVLWAEGSAARGGSAPAAASPSAESGAATDGVPVERPHPFASSAADVAVGIVLRDAGIPSESSTIRVRLPSRDSSPLPSSEFSAITGFTADPDAVPAILTSFTVPAVRVAPQHVMSVIGAVSDAADSINKAPDESWIAGASFAYFAECARLVRHVVAQQRFVPMLVQTVGGDLRAAWYPWMSDDAMASRVARLVEAMPGSARAVVDRTNHEAWAITEDFLATMIDETCRRVLIREDFATSIDGRDPTTDPHVAWLGGLLASGTALPPSPGLRQELAKRVRGWVGVLEERGASSAWRLYLRLNEPSLVTLKPDESPDPAAPVWSLSFHMQSVEKPDLILDAEDLWAVTGDSITLQGRRLDRPQELLLGELGRAMRFYKRLEAALDEREPDSLPLNTRQAYEFLREVRPILLEQGFGVQAPLWWDSPSARVGAKLKLESEGPSPLDLSSGGLGPATGTKLGVTALVNYTWEIAVGDATLSLAEFEQLAGRKVPLVRVNGRWVEIRPEDVQAAIKFIRENPGGRIKIADALRLAYGSDLRQTGIPVVGMEATGWMAAFLSSESSSQQITIIETPTSFRGTLRPYQIRGVSWLIFQERLGFGVCLADDMGLGKTVQLLALLAWEREHSGGNPVLPTLLVVPMSVVGNWIHETARFCPHLKILVHHGPERTLGERFMQGASAADLVITTYSLAHRDREMFGNVTWGRVVLDEAQYIKNPIAKQSQAVRDLATGHRVALTGTPVENRLTELWSIMDFLNPGFLGSAGNFRTRFGVPIERFHDKGRAEQLRGLIRPFVLRRLKSDPNVVADLPEKVESKEYSHLTGEQAALYEACVKRMLGEVDDAEGIKKRGLVLAALVKLKQVCDHPALLLKEDRPGPIDPARSGKCIRILELLDEVLSEGDQSLIFTQFREMGELLVPMLRYHLKKDVLFLHGGTTQTQRQALIDQFQKADGTTPILVLSLRAGGVGLNLTAATHVFHFDRWWNPAVENQATDRAYRIGQTRTVQVHKFITRGTLEERIDQMIESKVELAESIIGGGENWLTELNTDQLRDILTLRNDAIEDE